MFYFIDKTERSQSNAVRSKSSKKSDYLKAAKQKALKNVRSFVAMNAKRQKKTIPTNMNHNLKRKGNAKITQIKESVLDDEYFYDYYYNSSYAPLDDGYDDYDDDDISAVCDVTHGSCFEQNIKVFSGEPDSDPELIFDDKDNRINYYPTNDTEVL